MRKFWVRAGMTLNITEEEEKVLFSDQYDAGAEIIKKIFTEGRAVLDGETYSPKEAVKDYNEEYGTGYEGEVGWDL